MFPIVNVLFQVMNIDIDLIKHGFETGLIPVLISCFIIGLKIVPLLFRVFMMLILRLRYNKNNNNSIFSEFPSLDESKYNVIDLPHMWKCLAQHSIFLISIILLYSILAFHFGTKPSLVLVVLSWTIFFFTDDWVIISDYSLAIDAKPLKFHNIRIQIANILLTIGVVVALWTELYWSYATLGTALLLLFLYWLYFFDFTPFQNEGKQSLSAAAITSRGRSTR